MAYVLGGPSGEAFGFTTAIANFALRAMHEAIGLVNMTNVVTPTQGNQFLIPQFAPITYQDYNANGSPNAWPNGGNAQMQNPALTQGSVTASPAVATTAFDIFYGWTTSFTLAATLGAELGDSFAEKVDQRVCAAFFSFKATTTNTFYATSVDGFARVSAVGAQELLLAGHSIANAVPGFQSTSVLGMIRNAKQNFQVARMPGSPVIVVDNNACGLAVESTLTRLLGELTGGAVNNAATTGGTALSALGNELLQNGRIENIYGCKVMSTTFLDAGARSTDGRTAATTIVGGYFGDGALFTVIKEGLQIKTGEAPGGLQNWLTGVGYFGCGVGDGRRGGAINIATT